MAECNHVWRDTPSPAPKNTVDEFLHSVVNAGSKGWWLRGVEYNFAIELIAMGKVKICTKCDCQAVTIVQK